MADYARRCPGDAAFPLDLERFARSYLGLSVGYTTLLEGSGVLGLTTDNPVSLTIPQSGEFAVPGDTVLLDKRLKGSGNYTRLRFTLAHELSHHILLRISDDRSDRSANALAAALLMPEERVKRLMLPATCYTSFGGYFNAWDYIRMKSLAERLSVSVGAMTIRLRTLELIQYRSISEYSDPLTISA